MNTPTQQPAPDFGEPWQNELGDFEIYPRTGGDAVAYAEGSKTRDQIIAVVNACAGMVDPAAEIQALRLAAPVWQPIETAPRDGARILLYDPMTSGLIYAGCWDAGFESNWNEETDDLEYFGKWTAYEVQSWNDEEYAALAPTHWMPLPTPPQV